MDYERPTDGKPSITVHNAAQNCIYVLSPNIRPTVFNAYIFIKENRLIVLHIFYDGLSHLYFPSSPHLEKNTTKNIKNTM